MNEQAAHMDITSTCTCCIFVQKVSLFFLIVILLDDRLYIESPLH